MNLEEEILKEHSKRQALKIAAWIGSDKKRFKQLMDHFLRGEYRVTRRSAWIISHCGEQYPRLIAPWLPAMLKKAQEPGVHDAVMRNVVRILRTQDIPRSVLGTVTKICFDNLSAPDTAIAVRVHSMYVLANISAIEPDITRELRLTIEQMLPYSGAAMRACARNVLKQLDRQSK